MQLHCNMPQGLKGHYRHELQQYRNEFRQGNLQHEYNKAIRNCAIFVSMFFTKTGKFTAEEFNVAHKRFLETGKPKIYTFFKKASVDIEDLGQEINTLLKFKRKLKKLGHFYTTYNSVEDLQKRFRNQLDLLMDGGK